MVDIKNPAKHLAGGVIYLDEYRFVGLLHTFIQL